MKKISILGCGWLGLPLGAALVAQGFEVCGATTRVEKLSKLAGHGIQPFQIRVDKGIEGKNLPIFFKTDCMIVTIPPGRSEQEAPVSYVEKIRLIDQWCARHKVPKGIFTSSTGVYPDLNRVVDEETPPDPVRPSARAAWEAEQALLGSSKVDWTILRLGGLIGGNRKGGRFFSGRNIPNGQAPVNLVHRDDAVQVILKLVTHDGPALKSRIFNVVADEHPFRSDFYAQRAAQQELPVPHFKEELLQFKVVSNQRLKEELAYAFLYPDPMEFPV